MRPDLFRAEKIAHLMGDALDQSAGIHEDQRRAVLGDLGRDLLVDIGPNLVRRYRPQLRFRHGDGELELALVADVDDFAFGRAGRGDALRSHEEPPHFRDRLLRRAQADSLDRFLGEGFQSFQAKSEMGAPLVSRHGMDFVQITQSRSLMMRRLRSAVSKM